MRKRDSRFIWLAGVIVILAALLVYANLREREVEQRREAGLAPLFPDAEPAECDYIVIAQGKGQKVELVRQNGRWHVQLPDRLFPASPDDVEELTGYFESIKPESIVDRSPDRFADYGLDDAAAVNVRFFRAREDATPAIDLLLGDRGPDYRSVFARKAGDNVCYLIPGNVATLWEQKAELWRDKYPLREKREDFSRITIRTGEDEFSLELSEDGFWKFPDDEVNPVNQEETVGLISRLTGLVGLNLIDEPAPEYKLDQPEYEFVLGLGERTVTLAVSSEYDAKRLVHNSELDQAYSISATALEGVKLHRQDYVKHEETSPEAAAADGKPDTAAETP